MPDTRLRILDTNTLSYIQRGQEPWISRLRSYPSEQRAVTVISMEEQLRGRLLQISGANQRLNFARLIQAYTRLEEAVSFFNMVRVLSFDEAAVNRYRQLRKTHRRIGTNDLRIAAITLEVKGLEIEDWSRGDD